MAAGWSSESISVVRELPAADRWTEQVLNGRIVTIENERAWGEPRTYARVTNPSGKTTRCEIRLPGDVDAVSVKVCGSGRNVGLMFTLSDGSELQVLGGLGIHPAHGQGCVENSRVEFEHDNIAYVAEIHEVYSNGRTWLVAQVKSRAADGPCCWSKVVRADSLSSKGDLERASLLFEKGVLYDVKQDDRRPLYDLRTDTGTIRFGPNSGPWYATIKGDDCERYTCLVYTFGGNLISQIPLCSVGTEDCRLMAEESDGGRWLLFLAKGGEAHWLATYCCPPIVKRLQDKQRVGTAAVGMIKFENDDVLAMVDPRIGDSLDLVLALVPKRAPGFGILLDEEASNAVRSGSVAGLDVVDNVVDDVVGWAVFLVLRGGKRLHIASAPKLERLQDAKVVDELVTDSYGAFAIIEKTLPSGLVARGATKIESAPEIAPEMPRTKITRLATLFFGLAPWEVQLQLVKEEESTFLVATNARRETEPYLISNRALCKL